MNNDIIIDVSLIKLQIIPPIDIDKIKDELYIKISTINDRKLRANIDVTRIELEKCVKLCIKIMNEERRKKPLI